MICNAKRCREGRDKCERAVCGFALHRIPADEAEAPTSQAEVYSLIADLWGALLIVGGFFLGGMAAWALFTYLSQHWPRLVAMVNV